MKGTAVHMGQRGGMNGAPRPTAIAAATQVRRVPAGKTPPLLLLTPNPASPIHSPVVTIIFPATSAPGTERACYTSYPRV